MEELSRSQTPWNTGPTIIFLCLHMAKFFNHKHSFIFLCLHNLILYPELAQHKIGNEIIILKFFNICSVKFETIRLKGYRRMFLSCYYTTLTTTLLWDMFDTTEKNTQKFTLSSWNKNLTSVILNKAVYLQNKCGFMQAAGWINKNIVRPGRG